MSLTLKILLLCDTFFALLLIVYLLIKYTKIFTRRPEFFPTTKEDGEEVEVSYQEPSTPVKPLKKDVQRQEIIKNQPTFPVEEPKEEKIRQDEEEKLVIGSFDELEEQVKIASDK
jgi:hypothetical protein